jgi:hypothetical protein
MHGSSSRAAGLLAIINQYGGKMKETYGVPVKEIQEAIKYGVRKINIDTDIRLAMTGAVRKFLAENPDKFDAREWLKPAREAAKAICKQRYLEFGCEGQAARSRARALQVMANTRYAQTVQGELAQVVHCQRRAPGDIIRPNGSGPLTVQRAFLLSGHHEHTPAHLCPHSLPLLARGKVRDNYAVGDDRILMVASDRISAFDVIMGEPIPGKGELLTQMALFWFAQAGPHVPQPPHRRRPESVVSADEAAADQRGRAMLVKRLKPIPVEAVVRGYLAGSGWKEYQEGQAVCGVQAARRPDQREPSCPSPSTPPRPRPRRVSTTRTSPSSARWR